MLKTGQDSKIFKLAKIDIITSLQSDSFLFSTSNFKDSFQNLKQGFC